MRRITRRKTAALAALAAVSLAGLGCGDNDVDRETFQRIIAERPVDEPVDFGELGLKESKDTRSPGANLPVPEVLSEAATAFTSETGILLLGEAFTADRLAIVRRVLGEYDVPVHLEELRVISWTGHIDNVPDGEEPDEEGEYDDPGGLWIVRGKRPIDSGSTEAKPARIRMFAYHGGGREYDTDRAEWDLHHEIGHHVTLNSRGVPFGRPFLAALQASPVAEPTSYAETNERELMAENIETMMMGHPRPGKTFRDTWEPNGDALRLFSEEFGFAPRVDRGPAPPAEAGESDTKGTAPGGSRAGPAGSAGG